MDNNYYKKYLKYKHKYLLLGGNFKCNDNLVSGERCLTSTTGPHTTIELCKEHCLHEYKDNYTELFNLLLCITESKIINKEDVDKIKSLCKLLFDNLVSKYVMLNKDEQRILIFNIRFIISIASILIPDPFITKLEIGVENIDFNKELKLDHKTFYYMEDCYTNDLELFFHEYDNLLETGKSSFFYRSNLVNIALLFKCFNDRCIDKITEIIDEGFYKNLKSILEKKLDKIFLDFQESKYELINLLLLAYTNFDYTDVKKLYLGYIRFYYDKFPHIAYTYYEYEKYNIEINNIIEKSGKEYICYLSCILPSTVKFERFEMTKIITSYIGLRENADRLYNSLEILIHDFIDFHQQYQRKLSYEEIELIQLRNFLLMVFNTRNDKIMEMIIEIIHNDNFEKGGPKLSINIILQFILNKLKSLDRLFIINYLESLIILYLKHNDTNTLFNNLVNNRSHSINYIRGESESELYSRLGLIQRRRITTKPLDPDELVVLENALKPLITNKNIYDQLLKYFENNSYKFHDISTYELSEDNIIFIKTICLNEIKKYGEAMNIILDYLYKEYNSLFTDNYIYTNFKKILSNP